MRISQNDIDLIKRYEGLILGKRIASMGCLALFCLAPTYIGCCDSEHQHGRVGVDRLFFMGGIIEVWAKFVLAAAYLILLAYVVYDYAFSKRLYVAFVFGMGVFANCVTSG
jgi:hypothetical protein